MLLSFTPCSSLQAAQYRLELQQLKAEHAALQMLTQHGEQETVSHQLLLANLHRASASLAECALPAGCFAALSLHCQHPLPGPVA